MKISAKFSCVFIGLVSLCLFLLCLSSCQSEDNLISAEVPINTQEPFLSTLEHEMDAYLNHKIVADSPSQFPLRIQSIESCNITTPQTDFRTTPVYIDVSQIPDPIILKELTTPGELMELVRRTGANISLVDDGNNNYSILLSDDECVEALVPLVDKSKRYLFSQGLNEFELENILSENNIDETSLVPFAFTLAELEEMQNTYGEKQADGTIKVDWDKVKLCASSVIGLDILEELATTGTTKLSKTVLKKVFKKVATKICGPVGALIAVAEFSLCYWG